MQEIAYMVGQFLGHVESGFYLILNTISQIEIFNINIMYIIIMILFLSELGEFILYLISGGDNE